MTQTLTSATQLLIPVQEFLNRVNPNIVAQLCSDDSQNPVLVANLPTDPHLLAALTTASGMFEAAALVGERYSVLDLLSLVYVFNAQGQPTTTVLSTFPNAAGLMFDVLADLGYYALWKRRPNRGAPLPPGLEFSQSILVQLGDGKLVLGFAQTEKAGHPADHTLTRRDIFRENLSTLQAGRYYGTRSDMDRREWW